MSHLQESHIEKLAIELLVELGYKHLDPEVQETKRESLSEVVLRESLEAAVERINPRVAPEARQEAVKKVLNLPSQNLIENNETFHKFLTDGVEVEFLGKDGVQGDKVWLVDFENLENNEFLVCDQFTVVNGNKNKRPDLVLFVNGLPLAVIELKNPADEEATVFRAFRQLDNYKAAIPQLFYYNGILVASDGIDAKAGSLTSNWERFTTWKTIKGVKEEKKTVPELETLIKGMLNPGVLLELIRSFTVFEKSKKVEQKTGLVQIETVKKLASYHQYYAVKKAVESTCRAVGMAPSSAETSKGFGDRKVGVIWHTQGSGKSLSMVFYTGRLVLELDNPTVVVITDRNDLDDQLFDTFAGCKQLLRQDPVQADSKQQLKKLLKTSGGGIIFTTIQKFSPAEGVEKFDLLSDRKNIVVIADEAHRSQYGFGAKTLVKNGEVFTKYGFAKYLRDALPNASFVGFTGTPIEKEDRSTPAVFGNYIDIYDIERGEEDKVIVPIFYESRLAKVHLKEEERGKVDEEIERIIENEDSTASEKAKAKWTKLEAIVGHKERLKVVAKDIVEHFEKREEVLNGKGMIVTMSRRIAVALYQEIVALRPAWHSEDQKKGVIKVIMTSTSSDPADWQMHHTSKEDRKEIGLRLKDPADSLKLVIVRDMWLTGFDVPSMHTMYVDKLMRGHNLMQAIARVNRVYGDKPGGLIVDYIGIASDLKKALAVYTESGGAGEPIMDQAEAVAGMLEKYEIVSQMFNNFDYQRYFSANTKGKMTILLEAQEHILTLDNGKERFIKQVLSLSKAFALSVPDPKAMEIKDELGFFQAVKARLIKFELKGSGKSAEEIESSIRQVVDRAVEVEGVIDIFQAAGIRKPNISILSDEFLNEIKGMQRKNLALELLKKILADEIKSRSKKNFVQSKKFSEMLEDAIKRYQNNLLSTAQILEELLKLAKEIKVADQRLEDLGLSEDEMAFYDALADNVSAKDVLGDDTLRELARILVEKVRASTAIDWTIKESVQANMRRIVKRELRKFGYPPDKQKLATENILKQAKLLAEDWSE